MTTTGSQAGIDVRRLVFVTDHKFVRSPQGIFDRYGFRQDFFEDFLEVFEHVHVVGREEFAPGDDKTLGRSDSESISFTLVSTAAGGRWLPEAQVKVPRALRQLRVSRGSSRLWVRLPSFGGAAAARYARTLRIPYGAEVVGDPRESLPFAPHKGANAAALARQQAWSLRRALRSAAAVTYVSGELRRLYPPPETASSDVVSSLRLETAWGESAAPGAPPLEGLAIVTVGTLVPVKGHDTIIRALARARRPCTLTIVGDGPERSFLERLAAGLGVRDRVTFTGHVGDRPTLRSLMDQSHLFVLASRSEGLPRAMVEAMARHRPVAGTSVGGIPELVHPTMLFPPDDAERLAELFDGLTSERWTELSGHSARVASGYGLATLRARRIAVLESLR